MVGGLSVCGGVCLFVCLFGVLVFGFWSVQGVGGISVHDTNDKTSRRSWETHPPPPTFFEKTLFLNFGAKIRTYSAKIQKYGGKVHGTKTQIRGARIQTFDPR